LPGFYNVYNALAAAAIGVALGWPLAAIEAGLGGYEAGFGRMERGRLHGHEARVALVKNPVGCDEVLRTVLHDQRAKVLLFALNDRAGDGTDIAWIWDAHFEWLASDENGPAHIVCAGTRAADAAVRLKYAGFDVSRLHVAASPTAALDKAAALLRPGQVLYALPTYSAMLELRPAFARAGAAAPQGGM
jgi:UDP-N-acetylmuramyl tripeptide synthase